MFSVVTKKSLLTDHHQTPQQQQAPSQLPLHDATAGVTPCVASRVSQRASAGPASLSPPQPRLARCFKTTGNVWASLGVCWELLSWKEGT